MIEDHTNWSLFKILRARALLADSRSVLSGVASVHLPLVNHEADNSTLQFIVDNAKQCA